MAHRHGERTVGARPGRQPLVGELHVVRVVGRHRDDLLAAVAGLGHPVRVGRPRDRKVRAPHDQVARVPPVAGLGYVGLVAEHLRRSDRQVGVPVVEAQHRAADQVHEPRPGRVRDHRHGGDRREARDPVGSPLLDRVHVRGRDDLGGLVPGRPHQPALAACGLVRLRSRRVVHDVRPRQHRIAAMLGLGLAVHLEQDAADVGIADPRGRVGVPGERGAARAPSRLVLRRVRTGRRIVGLLGLPGDDPVLDVDLPRAGAGAVHAMGRPDHLVVAPPIAVEVVGAPAALSVHATEVFTHLCPSEEASRSHESLGERTIDPALCLTPHTCCPILAGVAVPLTVVAVRTKVKAAATASMVRPMA